MLQFVIAHHFHFCKYAVQGVFPIPPRLRPETFCNFSDISRQELQLFRQLRPHEAPKGRMCSPECYKFNAQTLAAQTTSAAQPSPAQASPAVSRRVSKKPDQARQTTAARPSPAKPTQASAAGRSGTSPGGPAASTAEPKEPPGHRAEAPTCTLPPAPRCARSAVTAT